jgi:hypothetical protein
LASRANQNYVSNLSSVIVRHPSSAQRAITSKKSIIIIIYRQNITHRSPLSSEHNHPLLEEKVHPPSVTWHEFANSSIAIHIDRVWLQKSDAAATAQIIKPCAHHVHQIRHVLFTSAAVPLE